MSRRHSPTCAVKDASMDHRLWEHCAKTFTYVTESIFTANPLNGHWYVGRVPFVHSGCYHPQEGTDMSGKMLVYHHSGYWCLCFSWAWRSSPPAFSPSIFPSLSSPLGVLYWTRQFSSALSCTHIRPTGSCYALFFLEITGRAGQSPWNSISCVS